MLRGTLRLMSLTTNLSHDVNGFFRGLPSDEISKYWDELEKLIELPLKRTKSDRHYSPDDVLWKCISKDWQCWVASTTQIDAVFITYINPYPTGLKTFAIYLVGGRNIDEWLLTAWTTFKQFAKHMDCSEIEGFGRKGWLRKLKQIESGEFDQQLSWTVRI